MRVTRSMPEFVLAGALLAVFAVGVEAQTGPPVAPVRPVVDDYFGPVPVFRVCFCSGHIGHRVVGSFAKLGTLTPRSGCAFAYGTITTCGGHPRSLCLEESS